MTYYTKEQQLQAMATLMASDSTDEQRKEAGDLAMAYQEQADSDCSVCRAFYQHSTTENEGAHNFECPHNPDGPYKGVPNSAHCFSCGVATHAAGHSASVWTSRGNYGSRLIDRMGEDPGTLIIEICDLCLLSARHRVSDSKSGKWAAWEPHVPADVKGDRLRVYEREDGKWVANHIGQGFQSYMPGDTAIEAMEIALEREKSMAAKGYPMGHKDPKEEK
jgi:hypothetical protein